MPLDALPRVLARPGQVRPSLSWSGHGRLAAATDDPGSQGYGKQGFVSQDSGSHGRGPEGHTEAAAGERNGWRLVRAALAVPVLVAFGLSTLPARALPSASVEVIRLDRRGLRAMPAISKALETASASTPGNALAQASRPQTTERSPEAPATASGALTSLSQTFDGPLPSDLAGNIRLVSVLEDGSLGDLIEEIPVSSSRVLISADRLQLTVRPTNPIRPGQRVLLQLPSRSPQGLAYAYPNALGSTPCLFTAPVAAAGALPGTAATAAIPGAAAAATIPVWAIVVGAVVVGVGVAAAAGAFGGGGGGGGGNPSSQ